MEDIEAHLGVLHNSFMEVNDRLNDLDTGRCRCRDVPTSPVLDEPRVSPSLSAVGGGEEVVLLMTTVEEDEVPLPLRVRGQRARRSRPFQVNLPSDRGRDANLMDELRESGDIVNGWEMPGPHEH